MIPNAILFDAYGTLLDVSGPGRRLADKYGDVAMMILAPGCGCFRSHILGTAA